MNFILFLHLFSILKPDHDFSLVFQIPCERVFGSANISLEGRPYRGFNHRGAKKMPLAKAQTQKVTPNLMAETMENPSCLSIVYV